jgi:hypothetical protein
VRVRNPKSQTIAGGVTPVHQTPQKNGGGSPLRLVDHRPALLLLEPVDTVQAVEVLLDHLLVLRRGVLRQFLFELLAFRRGELTPGLGVFLELLGIDLAVVRPGDRQAAAACWT